jgi:hypothetical protein
MKVIAAFGQLANGKDTVCDYLADRLKSHGLGIWNRTAFANAVKDIYCNAFGVDRDFIEKWKRNPDNPPDMIMPVRQALQMIGDGFRLVKPDVWIDVALRGEERKIISDGRYINESKAVKTKNGYNILIYREGFLNDDTNRSEAELRPLALYAKNSLQTGPIKYTQDMPEEFKFFDFYIYNNGSVQDLYEKVDKYLFPDVLDRLHASF